MLHPNEVRLTQRNAKGKFVQTLEYRAMLKRHLTTEQKDALVEQESRQRMALAVYGEK